MVSSPRLGDFGGSKRSLKANNGSPAHHHPEQEKTSPVYLERFFASPRIMSDGELSKTCIS